MKILGRQLSKVCVNLGFDYLVSDLVSGDHVGEELDEAVHRYPECCQGQPQLAEG